MINMEEIKLDGESKNIVSDNVYKLKELFPEVITEDKIDFDKLKLILGSDIDTDNEKYSFTWPGKTQAIKESQKQSTGTLRPCKEESKNWDTTKNLYIEGDNLEVLKLLQKSYYNKIKCIYIDPPYNTGKEFVYPDNYHDNLENYLNITGQFSSEDGIKITTNSESSGRYHSNWINMMYPRLKLARNLLSEEGLIFISLDDSEIFNLKKICDEIFGEENFVCNFVRKNKAGSGHDSKKIAIEFDYIMCYCKNNNEVQVNQEHVDVSSDTKYKLSDEYEERRGKYYLRSLDYKGSYSEKMDYPITTPDGTVIYSGNKFGKPNTWRWSKDKFEWGLEKGFIEFKKREKWGVFIKQYQFVDNNDNIYIRQNPYRALISFSNGEGSADFKNLMKNSAFDFPKPVSLINFLQKISTNNDSIVLDFFSGSATSAQSVFQLNSEDYGTRRFIMIQLPEKTNEKSEAYREGFKNICEIGKERIRKAGEKIVEESGNKDLDIGFKVFKLDSSNLEKWNPDYDNLKQTLLVSQDNIKEDRTQEDLIYEIMLKYGIDLTLPIEEYTANENKIYSIGYGALLICLDNNITKNIVDSIIELSKDSEISRVVFKDNGFASDADKTNIKETLRTHNIDEFITI